MNQTQEYVTFANQKIEKHTHDKYGCCCCCGWTIGLVVVGMEPKENRWIHSATCESDQPRKEWMEGSTRMILDPGPLARRCPDCGQQAEFWHEDGNVCSDCWRESYLAGNVRVF